MCEQSFTGERYLPSECKDMEIRIEHTQRYQFATEWVKGKTVLDAACGEGYGAGLLSQFAKRVVGLDLDQITIRDAQKKYNKANLSFVQGNISALPFEDDSFDVVISFETIEHVDPKTQMNFLKEIDRVLTSEGILIMSTPNKKVYTDLVHGTNRFHIKEFYKQEYLDFLRQRFRNIELYLQYPQLAYILSNEENISMNGQGSLPEECRYYIAVCSNEKISSKSYTDFTFNSDMYYFLNRYSHDIEEQLRADTQKRNKFEKKQESELNDVKRYVRHLETDVQTLKETVHEKDQQIQQAEEYAEHLETDIRTLKETVHEKDQQIQQAKEYAEHLETDIRTLKETVHEKDQQIQQAEEYAEHLETDIRTLKETVHEKDQQIQQTGKYVEHLEEDIRILTETVKKNQIRKTGQSK